MQYTFAELNGRTFTMYLWFITFVIRKPFRFLTMLSPRMKTDLLLLFCFYYYQRLLSLSLFGFDLYLGFLWLVLFLLFLCLRLLLISSSSLLYLTLQLLLLLYYYYHFVISLLILLLLSSLLEIEEELLLKTLLEILVRFLRLLL